MDRLWIRGVILGLSLGCGGCGLKKLFPEHPVMTPWEWGEQFADPRSSGANYVDTPRVSFPVIPLQVWGVAYDLDLVVVSQNPKYDMHEFASIRTEDGLLWIAKDADAETLEQTIVTPLEKPEEWFPEIPVRRKANGLETRGVAEGDNVKMTFIYESLSGDQIVAHYTGAGPTTPQKKRNGSTMCHSRESLLAVLDLSHRTFGKMSELTYNGELHKTKRLLGLVPFHMALQQTQGGLASGDIRQEQPMAEEFEKAPLEDAFVTYYNLPGGKSTVRGWEISYRGDRLIATQSSMYRTLEYVWKVVDGSYELSEASVSQPGRESDVVTVRFQPALPDMRRHFTGVVKSQVGIAVNGQVGLAVGEVSAQWAPEFKYAQLDVSPLEPWWVRDRHMQSVLSYEDNGVQIKIDMKGLGPNTSFNPKFPPPEVRFCP